MPSARPPAKSVVSRTRDGERAARVPVCMAVRYVNVGVLLVPADPATRRIPTTNPATALMIDHIFALLDASLAPRTSPAASLLPTCDAYTIATMPVGRKQKSVTRIAHTRWLGTLAGGNIGPRGYRLPTPWPGIGGGGSPALSGGGAISDRSHVCP